MKRPRRGLSSSRSVVREDPLPRLVEKAPRGCEAGERWLA
jgi:hypothetical protein